MPSGARAAPDSIMISAVYDSNILVSAFLSRRNPEGVLPELLRFARQGAVQLHLSPEIIAETLATLIRSTRARRGYAYTESMAAQFCESLFAAATIVVNPPPIPGAVPPDPNDDKIVACAAAAGVQFIVTRDDHLLSLASHSGVRRENGQLRDP
jgi:putative PIN family toxin of toxin-antitoxin system